MAYRLEITEHADTLLDGLVGYLIFEKKNPDAASHLINGIDKLYKRLEENPYQFPISNNPFLAKREYREALVSDMNYLIVFEVVNHVVYILGIFHGLENYPKKLK
ncbi:MAG: type II toxin-antitoxin system RelE/ParE family toxin [Lachnospiraceae bacterium]|nr:type II toxin-antitoxin system RelE/ParE family toxin [Lachnospiraceae bacterium]